MENNDRIFLSEMDIFGTYSQSKIPKINHKNNKLMIIKSEINQVSIKLSELVTQVNQIVTKIENLEDE